MTLFTFNDTIPASGNNPSADQPTMLANNVATQGIIAVDHVGYNMPDGGYHTIIHQVPYVPTMLNPDPAPTSGFGQIYQKTISGDQQLFYESGNGVISQISPAILIRASIAFTGNGIAIGTPFNCTVGGTNPYTITFTTTLPTTNYTWTITGVDTGTNPLIGKVAVGGFTTSNIVITMVNQNNTTSTTVSRVNFMAWGG